MDRRSRNLFAAVLVALVVVTGAVVLVLGRSAGSGVGAPSDAPSVVGVVVGVDSQGLDKVSGFSLRTTDQGTLEFTIGVLENGAQFPPGHLIEHQASASPVRVWYRVQDGEKVAIRLEDAS